MELSRQSAGSTGKQTFCQACKRDPILADLARYLGVGVPAVGYAVQRGEAIPRDSNYQLVEVDSSISKGAASGFYNKPPKPVFTSLLRDITVQRIPQKVFNHNIMQALCA